MIFFNDFEDLFPFLELFSLGGGELRGLFYGVGIVVIWDWCVGSLLLLRWRGILSFEGIFIPTCIVKKR